QGRGSVPDGPADRRCGGLGGGATLRRGGPPDGAEGGGDDLRPDGGRRWAGRGGGDGVEGGRRGHNTGTPPPLGSCAPDGGRAPRTSRLLQDLCAHMGLFASQATRAGLADYLDERSRPARSEMLSILFADMRGSTQLWHVGNRLERTQELINQFLGVLADAVL